MGAADAAREWRHHEDPVRARRRRDRPEPERDHGRAATADQSRLPAPRLPGRRGGRRARGLRALVRDVPAAAGGHRIPRRLADQGRRSHLPRPAPLGAGQARELRGGMDPGAAARSHGVGRRAAGRRDRRSGRPGHSRRVGQHGLPRRTRIDDPGRARRVHPARRLPLLLRGSGRGRRAQPGGMPQAGLIGAPPHACLAGTRDSGGPARHRRQGLQARLGNQGHRRADRSPRPRCHGTCRRRRTGQRRAPAPRGKRGDRAPPGRRLRAFDQTILERTVNGQPGLVVQHDGVTTSVLAFDIAGDRITRLWAIRNPEKLRPWTSYGKAPN